MRATPLKLNNVMKPIILLSAEDLKTYSPVSMHFEIDKLTPHILQAQFGYRSILGKGLYEALVASVAAHITDPAVEIPERFKDLLQAMAHSLSIRAIYYALPSLWLQISQKGLVKEASENSASASKSELVYLRDDLNSTWTESVALLKEWINEHQVTYPEYNPGNTPEAPYQPVLFY